MLRPMNNPTETARTLLLNRSRRLTYRKIAAETGLRGAWLSKLAQGQIKEGGAGRIATLAEYLRNVRY